MNTFLLTIATALLAQCGNSGNATAVNSHPSATVATTRQPAATKHTTPQQANITATDADKAKAVALINKFKGHKATPETLVIEIARELRGIPYVAQTLEVGTKESLVVNLRQLDCTTYVENVLAVYLCVKNHKYTFADFCSYLRDIRYVGGKVTYPTRQHYFTEWIDDNTHDGSVREIQQPNPPFTATQHLRINYMSTHASLYPMLKANPDMIEPIAKMERRLSGNNYRYIPKSAISNSKLMRQTIHDGDIIAITTSKPGLDTSHIGIAVWHSDGLHMLNASQIHKKVVEEPMTLYKYMQKHPSQTGIRIIRIL